MKHASVGLSSYPSFWLSNLSWIVFRSDFCVDGTFIQMTDSKCVVLFHRYQTVGPCEPAEAGGGGSGSDGQREAQSGGRAASALVDTRVFWTLCVVSGLQSQVLVSELFVCVSGQVQESFADCALDIKRIYNTGDRGKVTMSWTASSLSDVISVLLAAQRKRDAW